MKTRSNAISIRKAVASAAERGFVLCARNKGYEVSLERGKIYRTVPDEDAAKHAQVRVIDESGEDYLFPRRLFVPASISPQLRKILLRAV